MVTTIVSRSHSQKHFCRTTRSDEFNTGFVFAESGWAITASHVGLNDDLYPRHGVTGKPVPGWNGRS